MVDTETILINMYITAALFITSLLFPHCVNVNEAAVAPNIAAIMMIGRLQRVISPSYDDTTKLAWNKLHKRKNTISWYVK